MDTVFTLLDPEREANVNALSSDYTIDAINHNTLERAGYDIGDIYHVESWSYTFEQFAAQATCIDLPSNGVVL